MRATSRGLRRTREGPAPGGPIHTDLTELMLRVRDHDDHEAFARLMTRMGPLVHGVFCRTLPHEAEDLMQEVFLRLWRARKQYRESRGTVLSWVFGGIVRNLEVDTFRKAKGMAGAVRLDGPAGPSLALLDRGPDPLSAAIEAEWVEEARRRLDEELAGAPFYVQKSWELRLRGVPFAVIGRILGRPVGTIAGALYRLEVKVFGPGPRQGLLRDRVKFGTVLSGTSLSVSASPGRPRTRNTPRKAPR